MINNYFWDGNTNNYKDYHTKKHKTPSEHIAALYPLFLEIADQEQAEAVAKAVAEKFLYRGGLVTTTKKTQVSSGIFPMRGLLING